MGDEPVVERLRELGLSSYEGRAYVALLRAGEPLNGYEVAKRSGMPRSMVYETLGKLVSRGAAYEVRGSKDVSAYVPLPSGALLDRMSRSHEEALDGIREMLADLTTPPAVHLVQTLSGTSTVLTRAKDIVAEVRRELFVSAWSEELEELRPPLETAEDAGVSVFVLAFDTEGMEMAGSSYLHEVSKPDVVLDAYGSRLFIVVADQAQAVIGHFTAEHAVGVYTDDAAVVRLAVEYISHDIAIQRIAQHFGQDEIEKFWYSDPELLRMRQSLHRLHAETVRKPVRTASPQVRPAPKASGRKKAAGA
jgi:sugar-specific transcriptional regulator TrmB